MKNDYTMSKLEQYAMAAMQGLLPNWEMSNETIAREAFDLAEAMIAEGERRNK